MIKFLSVELFNFVTHKHTYIDMESGGSLYISGWNKDAHAIGSNGAGKSLIYDAIYWCLYDVTVRGFGKDDVIGKNEDYTWVQTCWLDDDGRSVVIRRFRNHPEYKHDVQLLIDGEDASKTRNISKHGTNAHIVRIFKMDRVAFLYSVIFSKSRGSICEAKDVKRRELLSHIIGLDITDEGLKAARKDRKELDKYLNTLKIKLSSVETESHQFEKRLHDAQEQLIEEERRIEERKAKIASENKDIKEKEKELKEKRKKIKDKIKSIEGKLVEQINIDKEITSIENNIDMVNEKVSKYKVDLDYKVQVEDKAQRAMTACREKSGSVCPTCEQVIPGNHVRRQLFNLKKLRDKARAEKKYCAKKYQKWEKRRTQLVKEKNALKLSVDKKLERQYFKLESQLKYIKRDLKHIVFVDENSIEDNSDALRQKVRSLNDEHQDSLNRKNLLESQIKTVEQKLAIAEFWVVGFGSKGLKNFVINGILGLLEQRTNEYLSELTDGYMRVSWESEKQSKKTKKSMDKLMLNVKTGNRGYREYHWCSEGERSRVWLSTELALNEIKRTTVDIGLIDECLDGLDSQGIVKAVELISGESTKRKMICISHREGVEKHFRNKKVVIMHKGTSTLRAA